VVASDGALHMLGQVVPQVPSISTLNRVRRAVSGGERVRAGPVPAYDAYAGVSTQPVRDRARVASG
jgi:hypothetical protein